MKRSVRVVFAYKTLKNTERHKKRYTFLILFHFILFFYCVICFLQNRVPQGQTNVWYQEEETQDLTHFFTCVIK